MTFAEMKNSDFAKIFHRFPGKAAATEPTFSNQNPYLASGGFRDGLCGRDPLGHLSLSLGASGVPPWGHSRRFGTLLARWAPFGCFWGSLLVPVELFVVVVLPRGIGSTQECPDRRTPIESKWHGGGRPEGNWVLLGVMSLFKVYCIFTMCI